MVKKTIARGIKVIKNVKTKIKAGFRSPKKPIKVKVEPSVKFNALSIAKEKVEKSKFYQPAVMVTPQQQVQPPFNLPFGYGDNMISIMSRDPWWIYSYWEIRHDVENSVKQEIEKQGLTAVKSILRVYDVTGINFNGANANSYFDVELEGLANKWYINVNKPNTSWCADIGIVANDGRFFLLARSNITQTPRFGMSDVLDEEWMCADEDYWKMFGLSGGYGVGKSSIDVKRLFEKQVTSGGWSGVFSPSKKLERKFWLKVDCELIVYGATEPDAKVTVQGRPLSLRPDGTFTLRYYLPDGVQHIPVEAVSNDGLDKRKIIPIVTRKTE